MYNSYEEYMREVLGYPYNGQEPIQSNYSNTYYNNYSNTNNINNENYNTSNLENYYPEIYKIIRPMITSTCEMYSNQTITEEVLEEMTMKIYTSVETSENRSTQEQKTLKNGDVINPNAKRENREDRSRPNNFLLKDLIKILLINELLGGRRTRLPRPQRSSQGSNQFYPQFRNNINSQYPPIRPF